MLCPPVATERLAMTSSGQVRYQLKTAYRDGTTHIVMEPLDLMARFAAMTWAQRLKRVFGIEIDRCGRCAGKLRIIASIEEPAVIARILAHLDKATSDRLPELVPVEARAPPIQERLL